MRNTVHERIREWLVASANGSLSVDERKALACHLAECPECSNLLCDPEVVGDLQQRMERHRQVPAGLEDRVQARVEAGITTRRLLESPRSRRQLRLAARACLALLVGALLALRTLDLRWASTGGWTGKVWNTVSQFVLRQPSYPRDEFAVGDSGLLASCHQLCSQLFGALLWVLLFLLVGQVLLGAWRHRRAVEA